MVELQNPLQSLEVDARPTEKIIEKLQNGKQEGYFLISSLLCHC